MALVSTHGSCVHQWHNCVDTSCSPFSPHTSFSIFVCLHPTLITIPYLVGFIIVFLIEVLKIFIECINYGWALALFKSKFSSTLTTK